MKKNHHYYPAHGHRITGDRMELAKISIGQAEIIKDTNVEQQQSGALHFLGDALKKKGSSVETDDL